MDKNKKLKLLKESRERTLKRIEKVKKRLGEEKENEDAYPGHESTVYLDDLNQLDLHLAHLKDIESEIYRIERGLKE